MYAFGRVTAYLAGGAAARRVLRHVDAVCHCRRGFDYGRSFAWYHARSVINEEHSRLRLADPKDH